MNNKADLALTTKKEAGQGIRVNFSLNDSDTPALTEKPLKEGDLCPICGFSGGRGVFTC